MSILINISNHPSSKWSEEQREGWDNIIDIAFPQVPPDASSEQVMDIAYDLWHKLITDLYKTYRSKKYTRGRAIKENVWLHEKTVRRVLSDYTFHVAGEFTLFYYLVRILKLQKAKIVVACTERKVQEIQLEDGTVEKKAIFRFVQWREL